MRAFDAVLGESKLTSSWFWHIVLNHRWYKQAHLAQSHLVPSVIFCMEDNMRRDKQLCYSECIIVPNHTMVSARRVRFNQFLENLHWHWTAILKIMNASAKHEIILFQHPNWKPIHHKCHLPQVSTTCRYVSVYGIAFPQSINWTIHVSHSSNLLTTAKLLAMGHLPSMGTSGTLSSGKYILNGHQMPFVTFFAKSDVTDHESHVREGVRRMIESGPSKFTATPVQQQVWLYFNTSM